MPPALRSPLFRAAPFFLIALLPACGGDSSRTDTAGASVPAAEAGGIPLSTSSEQRRELVVIGRDLTEQLRGDDGRERFREPLVAAPGFAMAHYEHALNAAAAKDFCEHRKQAVARA